MGIDSEGAFHQKIVLDIETCPIDGVEAYLEEPTAPGNYSKPEAISSYIAKAKQEAANKAALDLDLCRIVALGVIDVSSPDMPSLLLCRDQSEEIAALNVYWTAFRTAHVIGYNVLGFDLPVLLRRSLYLGVKAPQLQLDKYKHPTVTDLMMVLSNNGAQKFRGLAFYLKRFNLPATEGDGAIVPGWVAAGEFDKVEAHLRSDLQSTLALAQRVGCL